MTSLTRRAYAKINLTLDVGSRRPDGYHDITSIMQTVALHDTLTITPTPNVPGVRLEVTGAEAEGVPADDTNLVYRATISLLQNTDAPGVHITLHKEIPSQAGLGGGSSDAAATLRAVNDLFGLSLPRQKLTEIGTALGADVPFFLTGGTALVKGLGEQVTGLKSLQPLWHLVIIKPNVGVSTAGAYAMLDAVLQRRSGSATEAMLKGEMQLGNDFETVILPTYPEIAAAYVALSWTPQTDESFKPLLCGSGSALFRRVSTPASGARLAERIKAAGLGKAWVTETQGECE